MNRLLTLFILLLASGCHDDDPEESRAEATADAAGQAAADADVSPPVQIVDGQRQLMGTEFLISVAGEDTAVARRAITAALDAVAEAERRLSPHREDSDVTRLNEAAGGAPVRVDPRTFEVLELARRVSERSGGAFDVTFAALSPVWRSLRERPPRLPSDQDIERARALVDWRQLMLDREESTASLQRRGMRIDLGGVGKGHGVDRAGEVLIAQGIENFIVGGGGDLLVRGSKRGTPWRLGIQHPRQRNTLVGALSLPSNSAVVTSGDYERFVMHEDVRYHHIIDPRTGRPARGTMGVTLIAPSATLADAMSTAVFVLGHRAGMVLVEQTEGVEALIIDNRMNITMSEGMGPLVELTGGRTSESRSP